MRDDVVIVALPLHVAPLCLFIFMLNFVCNVSIQSSAITSITDNVDNIEDTDLDDKNNNKTSSREKENLLLFI